MYGSAHVRELLKPLKNDVCMHTIEVFGERMCVCVCGFAGRGLCDWKGMPV